MNNHKFVAHSIEDLKRLGSIGDEEAILELGYRVLTDEEVIHIDDCEECEECNCDEEESKIYELEGDIDDLKEELQQLKDDMEVLLSVEE